MLARFGPQAETDLLLALRRGAAVWPPLAQVLEQASPSAIDLDDDALTSLLGPAAEDLAGAGIEVLWPSSMVDDGLKLRAAVTPAPERLTEAGFGLGALLEFRWQLTLDGALLDADEIAALAEAKRPLIRLRGRWVILDPALLDRLRRPPRTRMRTTEALGAVLAGAAEIDGETVRVTAEGPLADLAAPVAGTRAPRRNRSIRRPACGRRCGRTSSAAWPGWPACATQDSAAASPTTWASARRSRLSRCTCTGVTSRPGRRSWSARPPCWAPGSARSGGSPPTSRSAVSTAAGGTWRTWPPTRSSWSLTAWCCATRRGSPRSAGAWSSPTRRSTRKTRCREPPASCAPLPAPARIALTGTPVENRLSELWAILDWTTPGLLGQLEAFTRRIARPVELYRDADATARFAALVRPFLLRRRKTDPGIAPELPRKTETDQIVPLTAEQVTLYEAMVRETMQAIDAAEGIERAGLVFKLLTGLKQICNHPAQYLKQPGPLTGRSGKLAAFDELTDAILAGGESMLVFTQYTQMATLLQQHLDARGIRLAVPARRRPGAPPGGDGGAVPGGRRAGVPAVAQGGRHRADPDQGDARAALRPLVEPGGRGPGDRPGLPDRAGPPRPGAPADRRGNA